jgi:hypothetical protein
MGFGVGRECWHGFVVDDGWFDLMGARRWITKMRNASGLLVRVIPRASGSRAVQPGDNSQLDMKRE